MDYYKYSLSWREIKKKAEGVETDRLDDAIEVFLVLLLLFSLEAFLLFSKVSEQIVMFFVRCLL